jgi:hypothetical protein
MLVWRNAGRAVNDASQRAPVVFDLGESDCQQSAAKVVGGPEDRHTGQCMPLWSNIRTRAVAHSKKGWSDPAFIFFSGLVRQVEHPEKKGPV